MDAFVFKAQDAQSEFDIFSGTFFAMCQSINNLMLTCSLCCRMQSSKEFLTLVTMVSCTSEEMGMTCLGAHIEVLVES